MLFLLPQSMRCHLDYDSLDIIELAKKKKNGIIYIILKLFSFDAFDHIIIYTNKTAGAIYCDLAAKTQRK